LVNEVRRKFFYRQINGEAVSQIKAGSFGAGDSDEGLLEDVLPGVLLHKVKSAAPLNGAGCIP